MWYRLTFTLKSAFFTEFTRICVYQCDMLAVCGVLEMRTLNGYFKATLSKGHFYFNGHTKLPLCSHYLPSYVNTLNGYEF